MKTILVTGGAGYIGSHTVLEILDSGYEVIVVDDYSNSNPVVIQKLEQISGKKIKIYANDLKSDIDFIFRNHNIDGVIHFAAYKAVGESVQDPIKYYDNNINSLLNVLVCCKRYNVNNFVFSSSCSLYGNVEKLPVNEETNLSDPESPYAYTKLVGERIISDFCKVTNLKAVALRYFNPVGAHYSGLIGELTINKPSNIIPVICNSVSGDELTVFGSDYSTDDGTCVRDYVHVSDIANAHLKALQWMSQSDCKFEVFNLGSETGVSVLQLISAFEKHNLVKVRWKFGPRRPGDVVSIYSDSTKAKKILNWKPTRTTEDMVKSAWIWYKNKS